MGRSIFGWSYPPGVTGNEPEIVGYDEDEICPECGDSDLYICENCGFCSACCDCEDCECVENMVTDGLTWIL